MFPAQNEDVMAMKGKLRAISGKVSGKQCYVGVNSWENMVGGEIFAMDISDNTPFKTR